MIPDGFDSSLIIIKFDEIPNMKIKLTRNERRIIRRVARIQISTMEELMNHPTIMAQVYMAQFAGIDESRWEELFDETKTNFERLRERPSHLFILLDDEDLNLFREVMNNYCHRPYFDEGRQSLKYKIWLKDQLDQNQN